MVLESTIGKGRYGSDLIVDLLQRFDIPYVTLNPGASYRGLHDSLVNYAANRPEIILCQHEKIAVQIAHGYAKATGKPLASISHDSVGLLHAAMGIFNAYLDRVPIILMGATGPLDPSMRRPYIDWIHTSLLNAQPIRDFTKWDAQPYGPEDVIDSFARAYRVAMQHPQAPVYLCYDAGYQEQELPGEYVLPDPGKVGPGTAFHADPAALDELADMLVEARQPVIIAEYMGRSKESFFHLVELAEALGCAVIDKGARFNFPTAHPLNLSFTGNRTLGEADVVLALDVVDLYGSLFNFDPLHPPARALVNSNAKIAEIGLRDIGLSKWVADYQQLQPVDLQIIADTAAALPELVKRVRNRIARDGSAPARIAQRREAIGRIHTDARARWQEEAKGKWDEKPMSTARLAHELTEALKGKDYIMAGANNVPNWMRRLDSWDRPDQWIGNGRGTAVQVGMGLGIALAYRGTGKLVVNSQADGDLMYDAGALWTAAHNRIPILFVMHNNGAYYNDWNHQIHIAEHRGRPVENAWVGQAITDPNPDFAGLARSMGCYGEGPFDSAEGLQEALARAIREVEAGRPALVDVLTQHV